MDRCFILDSQQFRLLVTESVESSLSILGENAKKAIIIHFMKNYYLKSFEEVSDHPKEFESFLSALFGYGSNILLKAIVTEMFSKIDMEVPESDMNFATAVQEIKKMTVSKQLT